MSKKYLDFEPEQDFLLPPSLKEFVPKGHMAHFVRELVRKELDLSEIHASYVEERGAPPFSPELMTALLLYAYSRGVYSSRKIAKGCEERMDFMAVCGLRGPNFRVIARFRKRHIEELEGLFLQVLKLCKEAGLLKLGHVAIDGTKIAANASGSKNKRYKTLVQEEAELEKLVKGWIRTAEEVDAEEDEEYGEEQRGDENPEWMKDEKERLKRIKEAKIRLEEKDKEARERREEEEKRAKKERSHEKRRTKPKDEKKYNFTDPESEVMKSGQAFIQGYNAQVAVDSKSQVIVAADVITCSADRGQLIEMLEKVISNSRQVPKEISADCGYCVEADIEELYRREIRGYVAVSSNGSKKPPKIPDGSYRKKMELRLRRGGKRSRYKIRGKTVEPVFGIIKAARNFRQFLLRGLKNVRGEFFLLASVHNLFKLKMSRAA